MKFQDSITDKSDTNREPQVLIIGAGPSGLMMACQLAIHNVPFRIIDKNEDHTTQSRALVIQARSVEILDQMGIAAEAIRHGKVARAIGAFINGKKIVRVPVTDIGKGLTSFPHMLMLEQSQTERILVNFLKSHGCEVERKTELITIKQNQNEVIATLRLADGNIENVTTRFAIAADGAHSIVREQLHIPFKGSTYEQSLFVLDCKADIDLPHDEMYLAFSGNSIGGFFPLINGRWRILGNLRSEQQGRNEITFTDIQENFAARLKMRAKLYDPQWISQYHAHHRYATTFRKGNCFLVGDAAHIHSPVGAQGMNTGLQDAYNLAWKVCLVLDERANDSLLDTYTEERIIIARNLVRTTDRVFNMLTSSGSTIKVFRQYFLPLFLKIGAPLFQKFKWIQRFAFRTVSEIGINYRKSSLSLNASLGNFPQSAPKPGDRLPFLEFNDANGFLTNIQELAKGKFFCLFLFNIYQQEKIFSCIEPYVDFISIENISYSESTRLLFKKFGIRKSGCYLIRPDMYVAYRSNGFEEKHLTKYLQQFLKTDVRH